MTIHLRALGEAGIEGRLEGDDVMIHGVRRDSREVEPGDLFVALRGENDEGRAHAADAVRRGAVAIMAEAPLALGVPVWVTAEPARGLALAAELVYGAPLSKLVTVGITGTNGKTTCVHLLEALLTHAGKTCAVVGTGTLRAPGIDRASPFTTPFGDALARFGRDALEASATHLLMEVSSHGLALHRVDAVRFEVAAFTNLTQDHLDFHESMEAYGEAKQKLFVDHAPKASVINIDDRFGRRLAERAHGRVLRVSTDTASDAEIRALSYTGGREGLRAELDVLGQRRSLASPLIGRHNLENLLVVLGSAIALGVDVEVALEALAETQGASGRLERVAHPRDVTVVVDYAHTPDALERVLSALRPLTPGRLFVVFGCGGDRDRTKRAPMGRAAAAGADLVVLTSDNPRTEDPEAIIEAIEGAVRDAGSAALDAPALRTAPRGYFVVADRREAIRLAIGAAEEGDTVLLAGKGHEDYQIIGDERRPFDDRVEARAAIAEAEGAWRP
jgi:UDP-N-acetylmuramoyl-L-alanyl-D-glutamate--2,6-diaminopimelate ligase